jgi:hypothetical protein
MSMALPSRSRVLEAGLLACLVWLFFQTNTSNSPAHVCIGIDRDPSVVQLPGMTSHRDRIEVLTALGATVSGPSSLLHDAPLLSSAAKSSLLLPLGLAMSPLQPVVASAARSMDSQVRCLRQGEVMADTTMGLILLVVSTPHTTQHSLNTSTPDVAYHINLKYTVIVCLVKVTVYSLVSGWDIFTKETGT